MRSFPALLAVASLFIVAARAEVVDFDKTPAGSLPPGWLPGITGDGTYYWAVEADHSAPSLPHVLKQSGTGKFTWCVDTNVALKDGSITMKFKALGGEDDRAGGLIWRWQDGNNYYVTRANALENNITIYHTIKGVRKECGRVTANVAANKWHSLRVDFHGNRFVVTFDGAKALQWDDGTFQNAGAVGLWTKADSVIAFDDFTFEGK